MRKLLKANRETLRDKYIFGMLQGGFGHCPIGICVAISDRGVITRRNTDSPELCKADKVCERIREEIERHRKGAQLLSKPDGEYGMYSFRPAEIDWIREFLLARHCPRDGQVQAPTPAVVITKPVEAEPQPKPIEAPSQVMEGALCKHCGSDKLQATYGQYGYFYKCTACGKNTPMDFRCRACDAKARIRNWPKVRQGLWVWGRELGVSEQRLTSRHHAANYVASPQQVMIR